MTVTESAPVASDDFVVRIAPRRTRFDGPHNPESENPLPLAAAPHDADATERSVLIAVNPCLLEVVESPTEEMVATVAGQSLDARADQLQLQISQLADHLHDRLRELDRREARLNARAADHEATIRSARMWLRERESEYQERECELRRVEELADRHSARLTEELDARQLELNNREGQLVQREHEVRERRAGLEREAAAIRHSQQLWEQQQAREQEALAGQRERLEREFEQRAHDQEQLLRSSEAILAEHTRQLDQDRAGLAADRQAWEQSKAKQQQQLATREDAARAELADGHQRLQARQDWIEGQKTGLEQVRSETLELHRQSLEMRLLAEQLWAQITAQMAPAEVTQAIAQLRQKLSEQYRMEEHSLQARRDELVQLGERIAAQHRELTQLRAGVREWIAVREAEIEQQAATLVKRELALDEQQEQHRQSERAWQAERRRYEQQIRDLASQLRPAAAAGA